MLKVTLATAVCLALATPLAATPQQQFDAAQTALDAGRYAEAREGFQALMARVPPTSRSRSASLIRVRLGSALVMSDQPEQAEPLLVAGIAGFTQQTPEDAEERALATQDLARAQEARGALGEAAANYKTVRAAKIYPPDSASDIGLRFALARTLIWADPGEARRLLDGLLALPPETLGTAKDSLAVVKSLRGRVELNAGQNEEAKRWFTEAARAAGGGTTIKVSVTDVRVRGDLALANYKLGRMDDVQKAVAFSGAGSLAGQGLTKAADMPLPPCAPAGTLSPDAVAVVEFAIAQDGRVMSVTPIYASRGSGPTSGPGPEELFTAAVRRWSWKAETAAKLDAFWRQSVRVELRCQTGRDGDDVIFVSLDAEIAPWLVARNIRPTPERDGTDAANLPAMRAELARRETSDGPTSLQLLPALADLAANSAATDIERLAARDRRVEVLTIGRAPDSLVLQSKLAAIFARTPAATVEGKDARARRDALAQLLQERETAGLAGSRATMLVRLRLAETQDILGDTKAARLLYDQVAAAPVGLLSPADPIRTTALLRLANIEAAEKNPQAAAAALAATGLTPEQCALVDVRPQVSNRSVSSSDFPNEARRWGTAGFVRIGYDITVAGKPASVRTLVASPPFIFGPSAEKAISRFEYRPVFRPGNSIGCTGSEIMVNFQLVQP